jgi:thiol-disulfide isomerase/thioredoxin
MTVACLLLSASSNGQQASPPSTDKVPESAGSMPTPRAIIDHPDHDFGAVWIGEKMNHTFVVNNEGDAPLRILEVKPACGCTLAGSYDKVIAPGSSGSIPVSIDTKKFNGPFKKYVNIKTNDTQNAAFPCSLQGSVKHYVNMEPQRVSFLRIAEEDSPTMPVEVINNTDTPLELTLVANDPTGRFSAQLEEIEKGQKYQILVSAKPPYQEKLNRATFEVKTNIAAQPSIQIPITAYLPPRIEVRPEQVFVTVVQDQPRVQRVRVINNGESLVHVTKVECTDTTVKVMEITPRREGKEYDVALQLPAKYDPAPDQKLTITTDDPKKPTIEVPITGRRQQLAQQQRKRPDPPSMELIGKPAPKVNLHLASGTDWTVGGKDGPVTILDFYATWCGYCKKQMPLLDQVYDQYKDNPKVRIIAVSQDANEGPRSKTPEEVKELFSATGHKFELALDPYKEAGLPYKARGYPTLIVVGPSGNVEAAHAGFKADLADTLKKEIDLLLAGKTHKDFPQS